MTEKEKYDLLLQELAVVISAKNSEIDLLKWQIFNLETKLKEAEEAGKHESEHESERVGA